MELSNANNALQTNISLRSHKNANAMMTINKQVLEDVKK